jgi:hypothetical protein
MQRRRAWMISGALVFYAGWSVVVLAISISSGDGHGSGYWTSIGLIALLALAALVFAVRLYNRRLRRS